MRFNINRKFSVRLSATAVVALFTMLWVSLTAMAAEGDSLTVTAMEWKARNSELRISGIGAGQKQTVFISDADSEATLGTTVSRRDGKWNFRKRNLNQAPCMVVIELDDGLSITSSYTKNAPPECADTTPPEKSLINLIIEGPAQVDENSATQYVCTAEFSDGSSEVINGTVLWAVEPASSAEITGGLLSLSLIHI